MVLLFASHISQELSRLYGKEKKIDSKRYEDGRVDA